MSWRRIFTAPGNPRVWLSLILYLSALVLIIVYRERIGEVVAEGFRQVTALPAAPEKGAAPAPTLDSAVEEARRAALRPPGLREEELFRLARGGNREAVERLAPIVSRRPKGVRPSDALIRAAQGALEEGNRALRRLAAGILLWAAKVSPSRAAARSLAAAVRETTPKRLQALGTLGLLGLVGARSRTAERAVAAALRDRSAAVRAAAARAMGRIADPSFRDPLLDLVHEREPPEVRLAALAGLVDLGLSENAIRSEVLRSLAARLADRGVSSEVAEQIWKTVRTLARLAGDRVAPAVPKQHPPGP